MAAKALAQKMLVWLSREERRLLEQRDFLDSMSTLGGLTSINASVSESIQSDLEEALSYLGDLTGYLEEV